MMYIVNLLSTYFCYSGLPLIILPLLVIVCLFLYFYNGCASWYNASNNGSVSVSVFLIILVMPIILVPLIVVVYPFLLF